MTRPRVAIIGIGRMGAAMARRLTDQGFQVTLYNRSVGRAEEVATATGSSVAATAAEAASSADVVIGMLADDEAVRSVYLADDGIVAGLSEGAVVMEMSTVDPETIEAIRPAVESSGADLLDAPVSGSVTLVEAGTLTIMVGGGTAAFERARPVLEALSARQYHLGDSGNGSTMKLAVNGLVHAINQALAEALVLAETAGVPRAAAYEVFANSAGASPFVGYKQAAYLDPDSAPVAFSLELVVKDLELITGLAQRVGAPMPQGSANLDVARAAVEAGLGDQDMSALARHLRD